MSSLALGVLLAAGASTLYALEVLLQAAEARTAPPDLGFRPALLLRLVRRPRWLLANALGVLGWPLQAAALVLAPLTVVQPALGIGLVPLALIGARSLGEPVSRRDAAAIVAIIAGVAGVAWTAPGRSGSDAGPWPMALALGVLAAAALAPYASSRMRATGALAAWSAGAAFAWSALATKLSADALDAGRLTRAGLWLVAVVVAAAVGVLSENSALQRRRAAPVAGIVFATGTLVPVALAPALFGERWPGGAQGAVLAASLAVVVAGAIALESSRALAEVREPARSDESDVAVRPAEASWPTT
jgi:hypothetical protein